MYQLIRTDIKFALRSTKMYMVIMLIVLISMINLVANTYNGDKLSLHGFYNTLLYTLLFGYNFMTYLLPSISTMFFSWNFYKEMEVGFATITLVNVKPSTYLWRKVLTTIIITMIMISIALVSVTFLVYLIDPGTSYRIEHIHPFTPFSSTYYISLLQYTLIVFCNYIMFCCTYAILGCGLTLITKNYIVGSMLPSLFYTTSTWFLGAFYGLKLFPFSTLIITNITLKDLLYDHAFVLIIGLILIIVGFEKWKAENYMYNLFRKLKGALPMK